MNTSFVSIGVMVYSIIAHLSIRVWIAYNQQDIKKRTSKDPSIHVDTIKEEMNNS